MLGPGEHIGFVGSQPPHEPRLRSDDGGDRSRAKGVAMKMEAELGRKRAVLAGGLRLIGYAGRYPFRFPQRDFERHRFENPVRYRRPSGRTKPCTYRNDVAGAVKQIRRKRQTQLVVTHLCQRERRLVSSPQASFGENDAGVMATAQQPIQRACYRNAREGMLTGYPDHGMVTGCVAGIRAADWLVICRVSR